MNGAMLLQHAAGVIESREQVYGPAETSFAHIAARWSLVLGTTVTAAQVALCLIDLKLARLTRDPTHLNSIVDVASYAACLREVTCGSKMRGSLARHLPRTPPGEEELFAMRWAAWKKQGIVVINLADVCDTIIRQALINEAIRLYGQREVVRWRGGNGRRRQRCCGRRQ